MYLSDTAIYMRPIGAALICSLMFSGCQSIDLGQAPCYDGWRIDESGASKLEAVSSARAMTLSQFLDPDEQLVCVHKMPSGRSVLIVRDADGLGSTIIDSVSGVEVVTAKERIV